MKNILRLFAQLYKHWLTKSGEVQSWLSLKLKIAFGRWMNCGRPIVVI